MREAADDCLESRDQREVIYFPAFYVRRTMKLGCINESCYKEKLSTTSRLGGGRNRTYAHRNFSTLGSLRMMLFSNAALHGLRRLIKSNFNPMLLN